MARNRGNRAYKSRREKLDQSVRNIKLVWFFVLIAVAVTILLNRRYIWDYIRTSFY